MKGKFSRGCNPNNRGKLIIKADGHQITPEQL
jgi:hypothetical protein